jgi:hypothetical protein
MRFKDFIEMTSTANIAGYKRITLPLVRRMWPSEVEDIETDYYDWQKKKKPYRVPQVDEGVRIYAVG